MKNVPEQSADLLKEHVCKSCGNTFAGLYCNHCGEKVLEARDRKFRIFFGKVLISTTFVDNRFARSIWLSIIRPGFLSREYVDGRRVNYMRPLQVFFILNLVYFLFPGVLQMFNSTLYTQLHVLPHKNIAKAVVNAKLQSEGISFIGFELMYNDTTRGLAKLLVVVFVFLASLPLSIIFRKRNRYFMDHLALSVELSSFNLAVNAIFLSVLFWLLNTVMHWTGFGGYEYLNDITLTVMFISTNVYFLFKAGVNFYNQRGALLMLKASVGILGLFLALEGYRFILFFITVWSL